MKRVLITDEQHGRFAYDGDNLEESARLIVTERLGEWWYEEDEAERAVKALSSPNKKDVWLFLQSRSHLEYEGFEVLDIRRAEGD